MVKNNTMQKVVVIDTNVLVSATINPKGNGAIIIQAWRERKIALIISADILKEVSRVFSNPRVKKYSTWTDEELQQFIEDLAILGISTPGKLQLEIVKEDATDNKWLVAAIEGKADYIISGDSHLKAIGSYEGIKIIPPADFVKILEEI